MRSGLASNRVCRRATSIIVVGMLCGYFALPTVGNEATEHSTAKQLVEQASQAQLEGDATRSFSLLRRAVRIAPEYELARWHLGQVKVDGEWLTVEEVQRRAAAKPRQEEYRNLRRTHGETPRGQLALARWCRKHDMDEESWFHWASVLSVDPNNEEALEAVGKQWHSGQLLSRDEIAQQKADLRQARRAAKQWSPKIAKWQRDVSRGDAGKRESALEEIRSLTAPDVIVSMEEITLGQARGKAAESQLAICMALIEALRNMPEHDATKSLVRLAIHASAADARDAAVAALRPRPQHEFVPLLLSGLSMPIESSFNVRTAPDGSVFYTHSLYREGPDNDWSMDARLTAMQYDLGGRRITRDVATNTIEIGPPTGREPVAMRRKAAVAIGYQTRFGNTALATESRVWQANQVAEALNSAVIQVLRGATGQDHGESPTAWWDWWRNFNEYDSSQEKDVDRRYYAGTDSYYYGRPEYDVRYPPPPPPVRRWSGSCFAKGTLVWTKTGARPIETLELGDLVLSQDVDSGKLEYKPVIGRTVRPPTEILKLSFGGQELRTTRGHPLWISGIGWRMAKELEDGAILYAVTGPQPLRAVEPDGEETAYNLVVADFSTYFVGESGVLVHDNTLREPTRAMMPGVAAD